MLHTYIKHGLMPDPVHPDSGFILKTPGFQEALILSSMRFAGEVWDLLEHIDERVSLRWVMPGDMNAVAPPYVPFVLCLGEDAYANSVVLRKA